MDFKRLGGSRWHCITACSSDAHPTSWFERIHAMARKESRLLETGPSVGRRTAKLKCQLEML